MRKTAIILSFIILILMMTTPASSMPAVDGTIPNTVTSLDVELSQSIEGNLQVVPITQPWSTDPLGQGFQGRYIKLPMTKNSSGYWETEITWATDLPDHLSMIFSSGSITDRNDKNYWIIDPEYKDYRVELIDPNMCTPRITTSGSTIDINAKGPSSATEWKLNITGLSDDPITVEVHSETHSLNEWNLTFNLPALSNGLYDLVLYAEAGGKIRSDFEPHALKIVSAIPTEYTIAIFGDQEIDRTGGRGNFNLSTILSEISIVNPLFMVNLGSVSLWGDEPTFRLYRDYIQEFCSVPQFMATGHRERFEGSEGDWPNWGMGIGAFERIIGPRHRDWWVGDHFYTSIYPGDHRPDSSEVDFLGASLGSSATAEMKTVFLHDPIKSSTGAPDYIPVSLYEQCIRQDPEAQDILDLMSDNNVDYYVHSSIGIDGSDIFEGIQHISTSWAGNGFSLIKVNNNAFETWGNGTVDGTYPLEHLSITYNVSSSIVDNDGTHSSLTAKLQNEHDQPFENAKITFMMPAGNYACTGGIIESNHTVGSFTYVNVLVDVAASSFVEVTLEPAVSSLSMAKKYTSEQVSEKESTKKVSSATNGERAGWTPLNPAVGDTVEIWYLPVEPETSSETTTSTSGGSPSPLSIVGLLTGFIFLVYSRRKKRSKV